MPPHVINLVVWLNRVQNGNEPYPLPLPQQLMSLIDAPSPEVAAGTVNVAHNRGLVKLLPYAANMPWPAYGGARIVITDEGRLLAAANAPSPGQAPMGFHP